MTVLKRKILSEEKNEGQSVLTEHERAATMLQDFGLSESETAVYITLLKSGRELGGSDIAKKAVIPRQYVYTALPALRAKGLIIEIPHGKQSRYKAVSQGEIEKIAKRKLVEAERLVHELSIFSKVGYEQDFEIYVGAEAIQKYEYDWVHSVTENQFQYIIGGNTQGFSDMMGPTLNEYLVAQTRKYITTYYLGSTAERDVYVKHISRRMDLKMRFLDGFPQGASHMVIRKDKVLFYSFLKPALLYVIKSPVVSKNYEDFFLMLWKMAEKQANNT